MPVITTAMNLSVPSSTGHVGRLWARSASACAASRRSPAPSSHWTDGARALARRHRRTSAERSTTYRAFAGPYLAHPPALMIASTTPVRTSAPDASHASKQAGGRVAPNESRQLLLHHGCLSVQRASAPEEHEAGVGDDRLGRQEIDEVVRAERVSGQPNGRPEDERRGHCDQRPDQDPHPFGPTKPTKNPLGEGRRLLVVPGGA
jgi:hypothetical protein